jgi:hypothetical protein
MLPEMFMHAIPFVRWRLKFQIKNPPHSLSHSNKAKVVKPFITGRPFPAPRRAQIFGDVLFSAASLLMWGYLTNLIPEIDFEGRLL